MREHLKAGTRERNTGRLHHSDEVDGYIGAPKTLAHGEEYIRRKEGEIWFFHRHGIHDNMIDGEDHKLAQPTFSYKYSKEETTTRRPIQSFRSPRPEYLRPPSSRS